MPDAKRELTEQGPDLDKKHVGLCRVLQLQLHDFTSELKVRRHRHQHHEPRMCEDDRTPVQRAGVHLGQQHLRHIA